MDSRVIRHVERLCLLLRISSRAKMLNDIGFFNGNSFCFYIFVYIAQGWITKRISFVLYVYWSLWHSKGAWCKINHCHLNHYVREHSTVRSCFLWDFQLKNNSYFHLSSLARIIFDDDCENIGSSLLPIYSIIWLKLQLFHSCIQCACFWAIDCSYLLHVKHLHTRVRVKWGLLHHGNAPIRRWKSQSNKIWHLLSHRNLQYCSRSFHHLWFDV